MPVMLKVKRFKGKFFFWILIFLGAVIFFSNSFVSLDPDFGWHLKVGQIIASSGIPPHDPFTYTMPSFHFIDFEWLADVFLAGGFGFFGMAGLSLIISAVVIGTMLISFKLLGSPPHLLPVVLAIGVLVEFALVRPVVLSWLFMIILIYVLWVGSKKWRFLLPIFFLLWANLHGSFLTGLIIFGVNTLFISLQNRKPALTDGLLLLISAGLTFINPYGFQLWKEIIGIMGDPSFHSQIAEWYPAFYFFDPAATVLVTLTTILVLRYRARFTWNKLAIYFIFLIAVFSAVRLLPWLVFICLPFCSIGLNYLADEAGTRPGGAVRLKKVLRIFWVLAFLCLASILVPLVARPELTAETYYPKTAVVYLNKNSFAGQLYAPYNWGGYLIWKLPEKKTFIDGRTYPGWRTENPPPGESAAIWDEWQKVSSGKIDFETERKKYGIERVLWFKKTKPSAMANFFNHFSWKKDNFDFLGAIEKSGWQKIYEDDVAVIYQKS